MRRPMPTAARSIQRALNPFAQQRSLRYLGLCSLLALAAGPALASDYPPPKVYSITPTGVNIADGSFIANNTDLSIGTLKLERFHIGGYRTPATPLIGGRFSHNFDIWVAPNVHPASPPFAQRYKPIVHIGASASGTYVQEVGAMNIVNPSNDDALVGDLKYVSGAYVYTSQDGTIYTFNPSVPAAGNVSNSQRVANIVYPDGRRLDFTYVSGNLKLVTDSSGYAIVFDYNADNTVSAACGYNLSNAYVNASSTCAGAAIKVSYGYTSGELTSFTDVMNQVTTYASDINHNVTCITPPGYSTCKIRNVYGNNSQYQLAQVTEQYLADGGHWQFQYGGNYGQVRNPDASLVTTDPTAGTVITDPDLKQSSANFSGDSPYAYTDANNHQTNYRYTGASDYENYDPSVPSGSYLTEVDYPEGGQYLAEYQGAYHTVSKETWVAKPGSALASAIKRYVYTGDCVTAPSTRQNCTKPTAVIDPKNNQTDLTYTSFGAVKTEWWPAPTAGAARPLKVYNYTQLYAWVKNSSGTLVQASTPVWKLTSEVQCQSAPSASSPVCDAASTQITTTYQYGAAGAADTLLLRGKVVDAGGLNLRTCYGYDTLGNQIWETKPRAGLTTCS